MAPSQQPQNGSPAKDDSRLSDAAMRKKKNADAQAAFRARRANYIATLEETVTNLEAVVLQLQDSCREARAESAELRQENHRLRHAGREREKFWRALWQTRKGSESQLEEFPPLPACFGPMHPQTTAVNSHLAPYSEDDLSYTNGEPSTLAQAPYARTTNEYPTRSPSISYAPQENDLTSTNGRALAMNAQSQTSKYPYNPYAMHSATRDNSWPQVVPQHSSSNADPGRPESSGSVDSPHFVESPTIASTADVAYGSRYGVVEEQKVSVMDNGRYAFAASRSLSPSSSSHTHNSAATGPITSSYQFGPFGDGTGATDQRAEYDYRRQQVGPPAEVTLHGGIADISSIAAPHGGDALRYKLAAGGARRVVSGAGNGVGTERAVFPSLPQFPGHDPLVSNPGEAESTYAAGRARSRRSSRQSRSPSPGTPPMSGTLAVIKAQAFGALRRTRTRNRKGADGAAKVALEALEARGIGMGVSTGSKRPRSSLDDDDEDDGR